MIKLKTLSQLQFLNEKIANPLSTIVFGKKIGYSFNKLFLNEEIKNSPNKLFFNEKIKKPSLDIKQPEFPIHKKKTTFYYGVDNST